jgi:hypothetical protein
VPAHDVAAREILSLRLSPVLWRSPHGHWYRVDHTGTHRLGTIPDLTDYGIDPHAA